jgi:hypothetical protein
MDDTRTCIGCGGPAVLGSGRHQIAVDAQHNEVTWHPDCHARSTNGCEICQAIIDAYPDKKDAELGAAVYAANPNASVSTGAGTAADPLVIDPTPEA